VSCFGLREPRQFDSRAAMQTMAEEPGKPKRVVSTSYAPVSCDECYAQKRKCAWPDDGSAACVRCARLSLACRFDRPAKNKLARRKELQAKVGTGQSRGQRTSMEAATTMIPQDLTKEELDAMLSELAETGYLPDVEYGYDAAGAKVEYEEEEYFEEDDGAQMAFEDNSMLEHILETPPGSRMATSAGFFGAEPDYTAPDAFIIPQDDFREKSMGSFSSAGSQGGEPPISNLSSPVSAAPSARKTAPLPKTSSFASRPKSTDRLSSLLDSTSGTPGHLSFAVTLGLSQPSTNPPTASDIFAKVPMPFTTSPELTMLLNVYFDNVAPHIEFIHRSSFFSSLASQPQYLLDSMTALAVPFLPGVSGMLHLTKTLIHRASSNLMSIEPLPRALPAAWTFIHLALHALLHESSTQRALALAHGYHAMASSTAHSLRKAAHMRGKPPPSRDWVESEQRRRTWFSVWMIGTVLEAASGQRQPSAYVDSLLPVPCSDTVWRRNRGKRETEEEEKEESEEMGMFVDFGLDDEGGTGQVDVESPQAEDTPSPKPSQQQPKQRKESIQTYTKQFASLQTQDIPASLEKYFEPIGAPFSPMATPPQPPHNAFAGIVELHALLENAMYVARGEVKRDKDKVATERALLRWEEMWDQRKAEIGAKVWFGGMIMVGWLARRRV